MHPSLARHGLTDEDKTYVAAFEAQARESGWTDAQIEGAYQWYGTAIHSCKTGEAFLESFYSHCDQAGVEPDQEIGVSDWFFDAVEHGPEQPENPTAEQDGQREREIRETMRQDPSNYFNSETMQRELHDIIARQDNIGDADNVVPLNAAAGAKRKAEIQHIMQTDISRYRTEKLDDELTTILKSQHERGRTPAHANLDQTEIQNQKIETIRGEDTEDTTGEA